MRPENKALCQQKKTTECKIMFVKLRNEMGKIVVKDLFSGWQKKASNT